MCVYVLVCCVIYIRPCTVQAQHSEYERERLKADGVAQHYRGRVREIQTHIANLEKKVHMLIHTCIYMRPTVHVHFTPALPISYFCTCRVSCVQVPPEAAHSS